MRQRVSVTNVIIYVILIVLCLLTLYPFVYTVSYSFSDGHAVLSKPITLLPVQPTLNNYRAVFKNDKIIRAFLISLFRTTAGLTTTLLVTGMSAYMLSKRNLPGNRFFSYFFVIPMYLNGGMIATFVNIAHLGLMNNILVYVLPYAFVAYYMLIMRTYYAGIPDSLEESAELDGAGDITIFFRIVVPLSAPIFATIALFAGVFQWNAWYDAMVYVPNIRLHPLQMLLQNVLKQASGLANIKLLAQAVDIQVTAEAVQMATLVVAVVPILMIYPFVQRYFVKGIMIGAVKA
jgi:putative aldouronate transport system permease protein